MATVERGQVCSVRKVSVTVAEAVCRRGRSVKAAGLKQGSTGTRGRYQKVQRTK